MAAAVPAVQAAVPEPLRVLKGEISRNATLGHVLRDALSPSGVHNLVEAARPVYDLARLSVGHPFGVTFGPDGLVAAFTYGIDELRTLHVIRRDGAYEAEVRTREYDVRPTVVHGLITSSLYGAVSDAGEDDQLAVDLAEIFAWDVDFNTELRRGDTFRVAVEKLYLDDRFVRYGRVLSAELVRGPRVVTALWFDSRNGAGYYAPDGTPLRKAFLRSPLKFSRISSGFTRARFHPILKKTRPHLGVDYAAPVGTPVRASGGGVVTLAGWSGGYGKTVKIRHPNGYQTLYGHLSRINVKRGQRVEQAEIIGAVGTTGLSTGPHLDYRMTKNGTFIDPRKLKSPRAEPILASERGVFEAERMRELAFLGSSAPAVTAALLGSPQASN
jgi:murein DD-endopeptidase MepM/ murein hydrolase activator NlpD